MPALFTSTSRWPSTAIGVGHQPLAVGVHRHVAGDGDEPVAEVGGQRLEPVGAAGGGHHGGAGGVQDPGEAVAQAGGGAGDDGDLAVEAERGGDVDCCFAHGSGR